MHFNFPPIYFLLLAVTMSVHAIYPAEAPGIINALGPRSDHPSPVRLADERSWNPGVNGSHVGYVCPSLTRVYSDSPPFFSRQSYAPPVISTLWEMPPIPTSVRAFIAIADAPIYGTNQSMPSIISTQLEGYTHKPPNVYM